MHTYGSLDFFLCSPDCPKQPKITNLLDRLWYVRICGTIFGWIFLVIVYQIQTIKYFFIQFKAVGRELSIALAYHLLKQYKNSKNKSTNNRIRQLLDNIDLHIVHSMNPDGFEIANEGECVGNMGRNNSNNVSKKKE